MEQKTCLFINRRSPYGSTHASEALEMAFALSAFEHKVSLVFMDDGVLQLMRDQQTAGIGMKNFSPSFKAWEDYEIQHVYVEQASLETRGMQASELLMDVEIIDAQQLAKVIESHQFIFND